MKTEVTSLGWQDLLLRNEGDFRYALTLTMRQAVKSKKHGSWIADPDWVRLTPEVASQELVRFRHRLNDAIYGNNWHRRLLSRGKPNGLYFIAGTHGQAEKGLGNYWKSGNERTSTAEVIDADGVISTVSKAVRRHRLQNIHYHCFIDHDLTRRWDNDAKCMVEARDIIETTQLIQRLWNQMAFGAEIDQIEVQDIYENDGQHKGWANYIEGQMWDADGYDLNNTIIRQ